jgi:hypothetical protein
VECGIDQRPRRGQIRTQDAELRAAVAGGDMRVGVDQNFGVDAQADAGSLAQGACPRSDTLQLLHTFDLQSANAAYDCEINFRVRFCDTTHHDVRRSNTAAERQF